MTLALLCALGASIVYGVASVLQAIGARREDESKGVDPGLLVKLLRQGPFVAGLLLDVVGALFTVVALRRLPLFVVQAAIASSLAVTAVLATRVFHTRLGRWEWGAIAAVALGLTLLSVSAGPESPPHTSMGLRLAMTGAAVLVGLLAIPAGRIEGPRGAAALGALAGLAYGIANAALRVITSFQLTHLLTNPATYAAAVAGILGVLLFATALQRGSVTGATGSMIAAESILPAIFGALALHEHPRHGWAPVAVVGFLVTIAAAASLSRFGEGAVPTEAPSPRAG